MKIKGSVAVVTGAGSGIGRAIALELARRGARVVVSDINQESGEGTTREAQTYGTGAVFIACDVTSAEAVEALREGAEAAFGPVDIMVNNAGLAVAGPVTELSLDDWKWQLGPNLWGVIHGVHCFLPGMLARGRGQMVNVASLAGLVGAPGLVAYSTTKFAVAGLSESLRFEVASRGVGVTAVCPGFVKTGIFDAARYKKNAADPAKVKNMGMAAPKLAKLVCAAIEGDKPRVVAPGHAKLALFLRGFPTLWDPIGKRLSRLAVSKG